MCTNFVHRFKKDVKLGGISATHFTRSCWENGGQPGGTHISWTFLIYRGLFLVYFLFLLTSSLIRDKIRHLWPIWATNLSFLGQLMYGLLFFGNILVRFIRRRPNHDLAVQWKLDKNEASSISDDEGDRVLQSTQKLNAIDSVTWLFLNAAGTIPFIITLGYWLFVFDPSKNRESLGWDVTAHGINAVIALIDILVIDIPVRMAHSVYTISFGFLYLLFSAIYEYAGGAYRDEENEPYIYALLNWREEPAWTVLNCGIALVVAFFLHSCLWLLFKMRVYLVSKFGRRK